MYEPTLITLPHTLGSPTVFMPEPLLPAEMNICTFVLLDQARRRAMQRALLPSLSDGRPPIDMLITSTFDCLAT